MNVRSLETQVIEGLIKRQEALVSRVFSKRHGLEHDEYVRLNGEWWGLQDAKDEVKAIVKKADV